MSTEFLVFGICWRFIELKIEVFTFVYLQEYGHRVRLATHSNFKEFVLTAGLEFYPLGGDPKVLAGCMFYKPIYSFAIIS